MTTPNNNPSKPHSKKLTIYAQSLAPGAHPIKIWKLKKLPLSLLYMAVWGALTVSFRYKSPNLGLDPLYLYSCIIFTRLNIFRHIDCKLLQNCGIIRHFLQPFSNTFCGFGPKNPTKQLKYLSVVVLLNLKVCEKCIKILTSYYKEK